MATMRDAIIMLIAGIIFLSFFIVFLPIETCDAADTITVGPGGSPTYDYDNIQDAINAANESGGDAIYVYSKTGGYSQNIEIDRSLTLIGMEGSGNTIIQGSGDHTIKVTADDVTISGFKIQNTGSSYACVFLSSVTNCMITNNIVKNGGNGIYLVNSNSNTIKDNNAIEDNNIGIYLSNSDDNIIQNNNIKNNNANGIFLSSSSSGNTIYLNDFSDNPAGNARDSGSNSWSYTSQGNYWDDYTGYDNNSDGIGDIPYNIPGGSNQDLYPLGQFQSGNEKPIATIISPDSPTTVTYGDTVSFIGIGEDPDSGDYIVAYNWISSLDDILSTKASFSTSSLSVGTHTIYFRVKDNHNEWSDNKTVQVTVNQQQSQNQKPTATISTITPNPATYGESVYFHGYGTDDGTVVGYSWHSNKDRVLSGESTFSKSDLSIGTHTISFKVRDNDGDWSNEVSTTLTIIPGSSSPNQDPIADAGGPYTEYVNESVSFDASNSYDPDGDEISYAWDFGDGTTGTGMSVEHTYNSTGNYTVKLNVTDNGGKTDLDITYANVSIQPTDQNGTDRENGGTPGFELIFITIAVTLILFWKRHGYIKK